MSRNRFSGICYRCGSIVKKNEGHFELISKINLRKYKLESTPTKWLLQHAECAIKYRNTLIHYKTNPDEEKI